MIDHGDPVAQRVGLEHIMRGQQYSFPFRLQVEDHLSELACPDRVQPERGLVQEQNVGIMQKRARHMQALLHAA